MKDNLKFGIIWSTEVLAFLQKNPDVRIEIDPLTGGTIDNLLARNPCIKSVMFERSDGTSQDSETKKPSRQRLASALVAEPDDADSAVTASLEAAAHEGIIPHFFQENCLMRRVLEVLEQMSSPLQAIDVLKLMNDENVAIKGVRSSLIRNEDLGYVSKHTFDNGIEHWSLTEKAGHALRAVKPRPQATINVNSPAFATTSAGLVLKYFGQHSDEELATPTVMAALPNLKRGTVNSALSVLKINGLLIRDPHTRLWRITNKGKAAVPVTVQ